MLCLLIAYTAQNLGDDLFISYICKRYKQTQFLIICPKEYNAAFVDIKNLHVLNSNKEILYMKKNIDLQILIGGSMFMEPTDLSKTEERFKFIRNKFVCGIPKIVIGANFGPYQSEQHYKFYKNWFRSFNNISFRDRYSYELFKDLNNVNWSPDLILSYPFSNPISKPIKNKKSSIVISCIFNDFRTGLPPYNHRNYTNKLIEVSRKYIRKGYKIVLTSFCSKQGDYITAQEIMSALPKEYAQILKYDGNIAEFISEFQSAEYIIGTRFHSIILGWAFNIPVFPIVYNIKSESVLNCHHFKGNYIKIMEFENATFDYIDFNRKKQISIPEKNLKEKSIDHFKYLDSILN